MSWPIIVVLRFSSMLLSISCFLINLVFHPMPPRRPQSNTYRYHIFYYFLQRPEPNADYQGPRQHHSGSRVRSVFISVSRLVALVVSNHLFFLSFYIFKFTNIRNNSALAYRTLRKLTVIGGSYCFNYTDNSC